MVANWLAHPPYSLENVFVYLSEWSGQDLQQLICTRSEVDHLLHRQLGQVWRRTYLSCSLHLFKQSLELSMYPVLLIDYLKCKRFISRSFVNWQVFFQVNTNIWRKAGFAVNSTIPCATHLQLWCVRKVQGKCRTAGPACRKVENQNCPSVLFNCRGGVPGSKNSHVSIRKDIVLWTWFKGYGQLKNLIKSLMTAGECSQYILLLKHDLRQGRVRLLYSKFILKPQTPNKQLFKATRWKQWIT